MSDNGTPMDGALVGAGSHDPSQVSPLAYQRTLVSARICLQERMDEKSERKKSLQVGAEKRKRPHRDSNSGSWIQSPMS